MPTYRGLRRKQQRRPVYKARGYRPVVQRSLRRTPGSGQYGLRYHKLRESMQVSIKPSLGTALYYTDNPKTSTDWANFAGLYDAYRVAAIKIQWIPHGNVSDINTAVGTNPAVQVPVFLCHDTNTVISSPPTIASVVGYDNLKVKSMLRTWSDYRKLSRNIPINTSFTTQLGVSARGYQSTTSPAESQTVVVWIPQFGNGTSDVAIGTIIVTWYTIGTQPK